MGIAQLRKVDIMLEKRTKIAHAYNTAFSQLPQLQIPVDDTEQQHAQYLYMLRLNLDTLNIDRARFFDELKARNIGASVHLILFHVHPYCSNHYGYTPNDFPVTYREYMREISLPIYHILENEQQRCAVWY